MRPLLWVGAFALTFYAGMLTNAAMNQDLAQELKERQTKLNAQDKTHVDNPVSEDSTERVRAR